MSDSDEDNEEGSAVSLTGFLFGNIDMKTGQLEDDILDAESKRQLNALQKFGLGSIMNDVMEGQDQNAEPTKKTRKNRRLVSSYDSSSDSDDESEDEDEGSKTVTTSTVDNSDALETYDGSQEDLDYDEEKSPSAVDFSDINELAAEEESSTAVALLSATARSSEDDTDYDDIDSMDDSDGGKSTSRGRDDKHLMPPPMTTHIKKAQGGGSDTSSPTKDRDGSPTKSLPVSPTSQALVLALSGEKKLETPLAAMMPSKYAGVDVSEIFPDFRAGKVLRFSRLFGPGKPSSLPQIWRNVKRRRRKRKIMAEGQAAADAAEERDRERRGWDFQYSEDLRSTDIGSDDEEFLLDRESHEKPKSDSSQRNILNGMGSSQNAQPNIWRHGPAELWYDMLNVAEEGDSFDYGFQLNINRKHDGDSSSSSSEEEEPLLVEEKENKMYCNGPGSFPDESYHMVTQREWEADIIWDGNDTKYKKPTKNKAAGWVPSGVNRTAQNFSQPGAKGTPGTPGTTPSIPVPSKKDGKDGLSSSGSTTNSPNKSKAAAAALLKSEEGGQIDDTWYSIFPVETAELVYGRWEDEVIWDVEDMEHIPQPKILALDPNDENIVLCIPDDVDPSATQGAIAPVKVKIPHPHVKKSKILLGKAGVINVIEEDSPPPSPKNDDKDPYNISNDEYYLPKFTEQSLLKISASGNIIQHSTPVVELRAPFIPTHMGESKLRGFHRPPMKRYSGGPLSHPGPHPVLPLAKHIRKKAKQREQERLAAGGGDIFFMRAPDDLTGKDGELILIEYCEEHPPLLSQVGMCSRIRNYYKRTAGKDKGPPELPYGEVVYAHSSPFLGVMISGSTVQTIENNLYRAPIYQHPTNFTDFLVIRTRNNYFIREIDALFTAGQECPLFEVPGPNSKRANNFVRDFLQVFIYRLFWKSRDSPRRIRMDDIKRAFPMHSESSIRKRLKLCADFKRTGVDSNWWVIKPEFRLPTEEEIRNMVSPEQCCAYFSLTAAEQRLKDAGYGEKFLFAPQEDDDDDNQNKIDDEVKTAPWNTTRAYIQAMKNKCLLQLTGPADPTGCGEGFSYIRVPNKPQTNKEEQEAQPKRIVTGTDADLRRLSLNNAKALLRKFDVPEEEIKKLSRWEVIDVVRTLSTEKAKAGEKGMTKFSRGNRFSVAEHQERYKEECQRIYELQNKVLSSSEVLSTDDDESSDSELSDIEEMGKNIENIISNKKTNTQVNQEKEEQERRELQKMIMGENSKDDDDKSPRKKKKEEEENQTLSGLVNHPGRVLKIHRTFKEANGKEYTRMETVKKSAIIDIYMRIRTTKDENFIRQFALLDEQAKEEMKKEKRRIQEQLRRIKRNQEKDVTSKPSPVARKKKIKLKPDLKMKCGACHQVGHMKTNKACPLYNSSTAAQNMPSMNVAMTQDEEEAMEKALAGDDDELVRVEGVKVHLPGSVMKAAEEVRKKSLLLKVPKGAVQPRGKKRKAAASPHCDYLSKKSKNTNRRRIDPRVVISSIFEQILNELREMSDSNHFHAPVNAKIFPDYADRVRAPMDLRTMREKTRQKKYETVNEFMIDIQAIYDASVVYNGRNSLISEYANNLVTLCRDLLKDRGDHLDSLERMINPLLDNDQTGLSYFFDQCLTKLKSAQEAYPFLKPVNRKKVHDYYDVIKRPMDLQTMEDKNKDNKYSNRNELFADLEQICNNAKQYNGAESVYAKKASEMLKIAGEFLLQFDKDIQILEANIERGKSIYEEFGDHTNMYFEENDGDDHGESESVDHEAFNPGLQSDSSDDDDMEVVEAPDEDEYNQKQITVATELLEEENAQDDREEGEYFSDDNGSSFNRNMFSSQTSSVDEYSESRRAVDGMLMMGSQLHHGKPLGAETPRNIHEDLEISESEDDSDSDSESEMGASQLLASLYDVPEQTQNRDPPEEPDDGLWF